VAGHIPGALNRPFAQNLGPDGKFKPAAQLRQEFERCCRAATRHVVHHCGSGVSAVPNVIAMELAGCPPPALYAGSWSEWDRFRTRPVQAPAQAPIRRTGSATRSPELGQVKP
jgi:thiosulfate/3-mercaptopyruvate sulfurtransferase